MSRFKRIREFAKVRRGASPRPIDDPKWFGGDVGWVRIVDVTRSKRFLRSTEQYLSPAGEAKSVRVDKGDLIMSICATIGRPVVVDMPACIHDGFVQIYDINAADTQYLFYALQHAEQQFVNYGQTGTQANLNTSIVENHSLFLPSLSQQKRTARILTTLDELIEKTEALIAKYQVIKQGLMHDLFTRGVDEHGHLRPTYEVAPELYKESELGWIPKEWEVVKLEREVDIIHGYAFQGEFFADSPPGEVLLVPGNFHRDGGLYFDDGNKKYFTGPVPLQTVLKNGDLVIVMTDLSPRTLILGRVAEIDLPFRVLHNQRIGLIREKQSGNWNRKYLLFAKNSKRLRKEIILSATGTTVRHTSPTKILSNFIPKASRREQEQVADRVQQVESIIRSESNYLEKLRTTKSGLLNDLLTGNIEVKVSTEG